jgi:two-component system, chemotaxis family, protein-glutamate methylesterase/glutaminase
MDIDQPYTCIALAASAGGLQAISQVLCELPADLASPILVVQHMEPTRPTLLPKILGRLTLLNVKLAEMGEIMHPGCVYIAPPDFHLLVHGSRQLHLSKANPVHFLRPCADLLFSSMAQYLGAGAMVVILSGTGSDGTSGIADIKRAGGTVIVQDPKTAEFTGMPQAAVNTGLVDFVLPLKMISPKILSLVSKGSVS